MQDPCQIKTVETFVIEKVLPSTRSNLANKTMSSDPAEAGSSPGGQRNNNYVDFNQFIMQHNLYTGGSNGVSPALNNSSAGNITINGIPTSSHADNITFYQQAQSTHGLQGINFYSVNPNMLNGGYIDNTYTSCAYNPFASGFNFPAQMQTQLQATAPEFVPRFSKLSLNDTFGDMSHQNQQQKKENGCEKESDPKISSTDPATAASFDSIKANTATAQKSNQNEYAKATSADSQGDITKHRSEAFDSTTSSSSSSPSLNMNSSKGNSTSLRNGGKTSKKSGGRNGYSNEIGSSTSVQKNTAASAARAAITDNRRFPNGQQREYDREERVYERYERPERGDRGSYRGHHRERERDFNRDNHRSNKRRDDWNRNRDRINGFRVEERYATENGKDSPLPSPEKKSSPRKNKSCDGSPLENQKLSQREKLMRDIETRRLECLVCVEPIKAHHSVWSCYNCYHILHLQCTIKWATSSVKSEDGWRCPACQNVEKEIPRDYYCFCGKMRNPTYNRQDMAHSCGEVCGRIEGCTHACTLLCHPGPCPPCQALVRRECGCGRTTQTLQCYLKESIECEAICGKLLNCELHTCPAKCHDGKCSPCEKKVDQVCHCGKDQRQVACTRESHEKRTYSCGKPCSKDLACGNHKCKDCCHAGECRQCKVHPDVVTSCPCGKMPIIPGTRKSCLDPIPVCEGICNKTLRCGKPAHPHHCTSKCHLGNCPPCNKQTAVKCRCGHMDQMIKCRQLSTRADDARCKKRCVKKRSCGKHKCNQECCIDVDHICPLQCSSKLSCGKHKCDQACHRGNCPPCYRSSFEELYCECGAEVIYPPVPCGTKRPPCKRPCSRTHPCEHPPQHNCHSAPTCPPCMIFTTKWCFGKHEQRKTIPCSQENFSCGMACGKALPCGRHKCIKPCHEGACQTTGEICKQNCTKARITCGHKCQANCHDGDCPETPCKEMVEVQCECGHRKQQRPCHELAREYSRIATSQLASSMAEMQRGNYMELSEILAPIKVNKTNKTLDCNEECRLVERNRRLAIGLQVRNPDLSQKLQTKYSEFVRNFAKRDPTLVKSIYDALTNLVKLAKESKQKSRSHSFPVMNREKRQLVHELCEMFGVDSVAYDAEPNRNVVATAHKDRSWMPATSIMEVVQRESGQRRVPVPSNNAWGIKR